MMAWQCNPQTRLRRTLQGGSAFLPTTATTIELDVEAFAALALLSTPQTVRMLRPALRTHFQRNFTLAEIDCALRELAAQNFVLQVFPESAKPLPVIDQSPLPSPAPESVHLQLNNVCNLRCPSCYVDLQAEDEGGLPLERVLELLDEWAELGVFQLALGGGEPLLSPKFVPVVRAARERGLLPNATTNGWLITSELLEQVAGWLGELRLSLNDATGLNLALLEEKAALLRTHGVRFGFNLIVTRLNLARLPEIFRWAVEQGAATINLIRPKPAPDNGHWYKRNALSAPETAHLTGLLLTLEPLFTQTNLTVDCAFSFLFHGWASERLRAHGVAGCAMGERFVTVKWNGEVTPCSHLHGPSFNAGNLLHQSFRAIWATSPVFADVRRSLGEVEGACGSCNHNTFCKGCRAVMQVQTGNWRAADHDCNVATQHAREAIQVVQP